MHWEWAVWRTPGQPWQVSYARRAWSAHSTSTPAMAGGKCRLGTGPAEDREPTVEDGVEMVTSVD